MFPIFSPLGFMGLAHESHLEHLLTFIASICWSLYNLVSTALPLDVQSWGRWWSPFILLTSALDHFSFICAIDYATVKCSKAQFRSWQSNSTAPPFRLPPSRSAPSIRSLLFYERCVTWLNHGIATVHGCSPWYTLYRAISGKRSC